MIQVSKWVCVTLLLLATCGSAVAQQDPAGIVKSTPSTVRVATFNTSLNRDKEGQLQADLSNGNNIQAKSIAEIIQRVRPQVLLLNEFDYDTAGKSVELFKQNFLAVAQNGQQPIGFKYHYAGPVNTGYQSGLDYDNNGKLGDPTDAFGFGRFPGQYGMVVLSQFPIETEWIRTFQKLRWKDMPNAKVPVLPETDKPFYSKKVQYAFRLSSKSHWDVPIKIGERRLHFLVCHPTPPAFDGPERRNQLRNHDEIRLFAEFITPFKSEWMIDDQGRQGGLPEGQPFVIAGDLNADPADGSSENNAIKMLLEHPLVNSTPIPKSEGAVEATRLQGKANSKHKGDPANDTADFSDGRTGNLRVDYVLPSKGLKLIKNGVFWPTTDQPEASLVKVTDHRMVWVDLAFK